MQKRFVSWAAVSSLPQAKKISVDDQLKTNQEHIERWNGVLHKELPIRGKSRFISSWEHACATIPEYAQLKEMIAKREFDVLIYLDRSRLGRKRILIDTIVDLCEEAGILTYATESPPSTLEPERNFAHRVVGAIESVLAQEEVHKITRRHAMGMAARVRNGNFPGRVPFGWRVDWVKENDKPVQVVYVDEEAKATIERIIDLYLDGGLGFHMIAQRLIEEGVSSPKGQGWKGTVVSLILDHVWRFAGYVELNKRSKKREYVRAKSRWPVLITEEKAKKVERERERRAESRHSVESPHLFSQLVRCRQCDKPMQARFGLRRNRTNSHIQIPTEDYRCITDRVASHPRYQIAGFYIMDSVREAILFVGNEENRQKILEAYIDNTPQIEANIAKATQRLAKHEEGVQRADDAYVLGKMSFDRYQRQIENLDKERAKIVAEIARYQEQLEEQQHDRGRAERLSALANHGLEMLEHPDIAVANAWFRRHICIWINNDNPKRRVTVEYL